jgi:hypothetical protein
VCAIAQDITKRNEKNKNIRNNCRKSMTDEFNYRIYLFEAIQEKNWHQANHFSNELIKLGYFKGQSKKGWRIFNCEEYEFEGEKYGCGLRFMVPTRDFSSPSLDSCHNCIEECHPEFGFYDEKLKVDEFFNLTNTPEAIMLSP